MSMKEFEISKNDASQRLDKFITKAVPRLPLSLMQKYIRTKRIKVNNKRSQKDYRLIEGDTVQLYINDEFFEAKYEDENDFIKLKTSLDIVYEDENIILINKPKGMLCHDDDKESFNTLANHIKSYLYHKNEYDPQSENSFVPSLCNRIDRNTQGIVIAAKNAASLRIMNEKIKNREIDKYYICIAHGYFKEKCGILKGYLTKDSVKKEIKVYKSKVPGAMSIITGYTVLNEKDGLSLVEVKLETGRTHQIRAHFASVGHPLLGDGKYGTNASNKQYGLKSQALCSYKLKFNFKTDGDILSYLNGKTFEIDLPEIFKSF